jgi:hypothetical protein
MRFRKLRIAWSVFWGFACVLLIVLWVRSYRSHENVWFNVTNSRVLTFSSEQGELACQWVATMPLFDFTWIRDISMVRRGSSTWKFIKSPIEWIVFLPYWFPTLVSASLGIAPWASWKFSVRTLLIATTLVAVLLGLIMWMVAA